MAWQTILEWIAFAFLFAFGIYTMIVIKNEKNNYLANAREIIFKQFKMKIPTWWGEVPTESSDELCFKRLDTRYEWEAKFIWNQPGSKIDLIELLKIIFKKERYSLMRTLVSFTTQVISKQDLSLVRVNMKWLDLKELQRPIAMKDSTMMLL